MFKRVFLVVFVVCCWGCAKKGEVHVRKSPKTTSLTPKIKGIQDLGGLPVMANGKVSFAHFDGRITPGEWILVTGENLSEEGSEVRIGGVLTPVEVRFSNGVLVRMPRDVPAFQTVNISVKTPLGEDGVAIQPQAYLIVSDTSDNRLRFFRTTVQQTVAQGFEPECPSVPLSRVRFHVRSRSGAIAYAVSAVKDTPSKEVEPRAMQLVHLGAKDRPFPIGSVVFSSMDGPTDMALDPAGERLVVLTNTELLVFDVKNEIEPQLLSLTQLSHDRISEGGYTGLALMNGGNKGVLLDALSNTLTIVDLSNAESPRIVSHVTAIEDEMPRLVDMTVDRQDDTLLHLIAGPNLRLAKNLFHKFADRIKARISGEGTSRPSRLIRFKLEGESLEQTGEYLLPKGSIPLHVLSEDTGATLISAVDFSVLKLQSPDSVMDGVRTVVNVLLDVVKLGSVFRVDNGGQVTKAADGISLFLTMSQIPATNDVAALVMRVKAKKFPPSAGVKLSIDTWGKDGARRGENLLRDLSWTFLMPPYTTPVISFD